MSMRYGWDGLFGDFRLAGPQWEADSAFLACLVIYIPFCSFCPLVFARWFVWFFVS